MATNIEMNVKQEDGQYEIIYPQTSVENIVDIDDTLRNYYTKEQTLQNITGEMFDINSNIPDNVFQFLGKYNLYWWRKSKKAWTTNQASQEFECFRSTNTGANESFYYSTSLNDEDLQKGVISLNSPTLTPIYNGRQEMSYYSNIFSNKYVQNDSGYIYYIGENATFEKKYSDNGQTIIYTVNAFIVTAQLENNNISYVYSSNINQYPNYGEQASYFYQSLGKPFDNFSTNCQKISWGFYEGTGLYGSANPNSIIFDRAVDLVIIFNESSFPTFFFNGDNTKKPLVTGTYNGYYNTVSFPINPGNLISWYVNSPASYWYSSGSSNGNLSGNSQLNGLGIIYYYIGISF